MRLIGNPLNRAGVQGRGMELREESIFDPLLVRVGRDYFAEKLVRMALRGDLVVRVGHRVYKPSLNLLAVVVGLATRHVWREASGVPCPVKVERRRQKRIDPRLAGF
jgi:hypothetical protein